MKFLTRKNKGAKKNWRRTNHKRLSTHYRKKHFYALKKIRQLLPLKFISFIFFILILFSLSISFFYYKYFLLKKTPNNGSFNFQSCSLFNKNKITTLSDTYGYFILMNDQKIYTTYLLHFSEAKNVYPSKMNIIKMPGDLWIKTINSPSFKYSTINSIFKAGLVDDLEKPLCFSLKNLSYQIGAPIDFVIVENDSTNSYLQNILINPKSINIFDNIKNLSKMKNISSTVDINFIFSLQKNLVRYKSTTNYYTLDNKVTSEIITPEGNIIHILNFQLFLDKYPEALSSNLIYKEQALIEIYNATDTNRVASIYSRYIRSIGGNIIRLGSMPIIPSKYDLDIYIANEKTYSLTIKTIEKIFSKKSIRIIRNQRPNGIVTTGDIILIIHTP